jgi:hypothetical protein
MSLFDRKIVGFIWRGVLDIIAFQGGDDDGRGYRNMYKIPRGPNLNQRDWYLNPFKLLQTKALLQYSTRVPVLYGCLYKGVDIYSNPLVLYNMLKTRYTPLIFLPRHLAR